MSEGRQGDASGLVIESAIIETLFLPNGQSKSILYTTEAMTPVYEEVRRIIGPGMKLRLENVHPAIWSLVRQGLVYFRPHGTGYSEVTAFSLTPAGLAAARDEAYNPDHSSRYVETLVAAVPEASPLVIQYINEAQTCYTNLCYLASAVMIGVTLEAAFLEMAESLAASLKALQEPKLEEVLANPRNSFNEKLKMFQQVSEPRRKVFNKAQPVLGDQALSTLSQIVDVIRLTRNEAGHPTGRVFNREDTHTNLRLLIPALRTIYSLKAIIESGSVNLKV